MSDLDSQIRDYARWLADTADAAAGRSDAADPLPAAPMPSPWRRRSVLLAAAAAAVLLVVALAAIVRRASDEVPASPTPPTAPPTTSVGDAVGLADGYELDVVGRPTVVAGIEVWRGAPAPVLDEAAVARLTSDAVPAELVPLPPSDVASIGDVLADGVDRAVTVGVVDDVSIVAHATSSERTDVRCVVMSTGDGDWLGGCGSARPGGTTLGLGGGVGRWIVWTDLPDGTALVTLRADGASGYQRPIARTVAFPAGLLDEAATELVAYDTAGRTIATEPSPYAPASADPGIVATTTLPDGPRSIVMDVHCGVGWFPYRDEWWTIDGGPWRPVPREWEALMDRSYRPDDLPLVLVDEGNVLQLSGGGLTIEFVRAATPEPSCD